ncbi:hypothetical protein TWF730_004019 [Orbilia blumenaviensis]|uniref:Uncharacterized protein n=1 Tax=Orbilia blumenaviensis TaxID=1796055 RepID=A0AAV9U353_9PEZI
MLFSSTLLILLGIAGVQADLKNKLAYPNGLHEKVDAGILEHTNPEQHNIKKWNNDLIPSGCKVRFTELGIDPKDTEVYNITYAHGCLQSWIFCRAKNSPVDIKTMASLFGRLPLHMRALVRHPISVPDDSCSALAYTDRGDILFKGNCKTPSVWIHETGHQMDAMLKPSDAESGSQAWKTALSKDSCVPDSYANVNAIEDFAQVTVIALFKVIRGFIPKPSDPGCFNNQLNRILDKYRAKYLIYGGICEGKVPPSRFVKKDAQDRLALEEEDRNKVVACGVKFADE